MTNHYNNFIRRVSKLLFLLLIVESLYSNSFQSSFGFINGKSTYIASKNDLKAKLEFPYNIYYLDLKYSKITNQNNEIYILFGSKLYENNSLGKDTDWYKKQLSVYSYSKQELDNYYKFNIGINNFINTNQQINFYFQQKYLQFNWYDTIQNDYIKNETYSIDKNTLSYDQNFKSINLSYIFKITYKKFKIKFSPTVSYLNIKSTDSHLLRNFYTIQKNYGFGYKLNINVKYQNFALNTFYTKFEDNDASMQYYYNTGYLYDTIKSELSHEEKGLILSYTFKFY